MRLLFCAGLLAAGTAAAVAAPEAKPSWPAVKCARYGTAWTEVLRRWGRDGLGPEFLAAHETFLASGCTAPAAVCPRSPTEIEVANALTVAAMNAGTASTFLPFSCRP